MKKGKTQFTQTEVSAIEVLIKKKLRALPTDQKRIRNEIRRLGFYYSDFRDDKRGYNVEDLRNLIKSGEITIVELASLQHSLTESNSPSFCSSKDIQAENHGSWKVVETKLITKGKIVSCKDVDQLIPDEAGYYCIRLGEKAQLPIEYQSILDQRGHRIIYIGIAMERTLKQRLLGNELRGKGHGTFFRGIGAVLGFRPPRGSLKGKSNQRNYTFSEKDIQEIIKWMNHNLDVSWIETFVNPEIEKVLIETYCPPFNSDHNPEKLKVLSDLRKDCRRIATS